MSVVESGDTIKFNNKELLKFLKSFKGHTPEVKVGVLGGKTSRTGGELTNAEIGKKHEFGDDGMPMRSFLRMPITRYLEKYLEKSGAFTEQALRKIIKSGSLLEWIKKVGVVAESVVLEAFNTGGFGMWVPSNMNRKKNHQTLVETKQLRDSITSEVE